jgi:hypothetical protein
MHWRFLRLTDGEASAAHRQAASDAWASIGRADLIAEYL